MDANSEGLKRLALMMYERLLKEVKAYETDKKSADIDFIRLWAGDPLVRPLLSVAEAAHVDRVKNEVWEAAFKRVLHNCRHGLS